MTADLAEPDRRINCRIGSLEICRLDWKMKPLINCRIGSLEIRVLIS